MGNQPGMQAMQAQLHAQATGQPLPPLDLDPESVVITNINFQASPEDVGMHFLHNCGDVVRVTILKNAHGMPKGYAYMQFASAAAAVKALQLNGTEFMGRQLRVRSFVPPLTAMSHRPCAMHRRPCYHPSIGSLSRLHLAVLYPALFCILCPGSLKVARVSMPWGCLQLVCEFSHVGGLRAGP